MNDRAILKRVHVSGMNCYLMCPGWTISLEKMRYDQESVSRVSADSSESIGDFSKNFRTSLEGCGRLRQGIRQFDIGT